MRKLTLLFLVLQGTLIGQGRIPGGYFGINWWMPAQFINEPPNNPNGQIENPTVQSALNAAYPVVYRIGGNDYDSKGTAIGTSSLTNDYIYAMEVARKNNPAAKFIVQVPWESGISLDSTRALVQRVTSYFGEHFMWAIGNEWDRYRHPNTKKFLMHEIVQPLKDYATVIRDADSLCTIVGPSLSFFTAEDSLGNRIMDAITATTGTNSLVGKIDNPAFIFLHNRHYYFDIISYNTYPENLSNDTTGTNYFNSRDELIDNANDPSQGLAEELDSLVKWLNAANALRPASPLKFAITEMNVTFLNQPMTAVTTTNPKLLNTAEGLSARSFFAGQHLACVFATVLEKGTDPNNAKCAFVLPWSIHEGGGDGDPRDLGLLKGDNVNGYKELSTYHHYQLLSKRFFTGRYFPSASNTHTRAVRAFAAVQDSVGAYVVVINRDSVSYNLTLDLNGQNTNGSGLNIDFAINTNYLELDSGSVFTETIQPNSTTVWLYTCHGVEVYKQVYTLEDAKLDGDPKFRRIGRRDIDADAHANCEEDMLEGEKTSNVSYANTTIFITDDIVLKGVTLTLDNVIAIINPGVKIIGESGSKIDIKNGTVLYGCNGPWGGIEIEGTNTTGSDDLDIRDSYLYNAVVAVRAKNMPDVDIVHNIMANGTTGVELEGCQRFNIDRNAFAGYETGIKTSNTPPSFVSSISENYVLHTTNALEFDNDDHAQLTVACNIFTEYSEFGILSNNTTLSNFGTSMMSAGNAFFRMGGSPSNFIQHSGNAPTYYIGPFEASTYAGYTTMNITQSPAMADNTCAASVVAAYICKNLQIIGVDEIADRKNILEIYPNPSLGQFTLRYQGKGVQTLAVYDVTGRLVLNRLVDFTDSDTATFNIAARGLYVVTLTGSGTRFSQKVIVE